MKQGGKYWKIYLFVFVAFLASCQNDMNEMAKMQIQLCLPMQEKIDNSPLRVMGDPGTYERFTFPHYLYFFVLKKQDDDSWVVWNKISKTVTDNDWTYTYYNGDLQTYGDYIYQYKEFVTLMLSNEKFDGRVYAIASNVELSFDQDFNDLNDLDDILNLKFSTASTAIQENLQHIYSTPYNYDKNDIYYGSFSSKNQNVPHVNLLLYHVAAKVDITWNVADAVRLNKADPSAAVRLTGMKAKNLFNGNAYCFKPMENSSGATPVSSGEEITFVQPTDEGLWWEGRSYFYTIPYTTTADGKEDYFPLQMELETNGSGNLYQPTIYLEIDKSSPFVPWLRANFNLTAPLAAGSAEKVVDN